MDIFEKMTYIINSGIGRDKVCRIIQYFLMGVLPMMQARGAHMTDICTRLGHLKGSMSKTRKVLRFGKEIPLITAIKNRLAAHEKEPQRMVFWRTIADISLILYFFTDHPLYFQSIGFWTYEKSFINNLDYINNVFWLLNSLLDIMCTVADTQHLQKEIKEKVSLSEITFVCGRHFLSNRQAQTRNKREVRRCATSKSSTWPSASTSRATSSTYP